MPRIMIVDDDRASLKSLYRMVTGIEGYEVDAFISAHEALQSAASRDYALIMTDYRMPEMDGVALLKKVKQVQPGAARIILSGRCDKQSLYSAINEANALRYIEKPCHPEALQGILSEVLADRQRENPPTVQELLGVIRDMEMIIKEQARQINSLKVRAQEENFTSPSVSSM